VVIFGEAHLRRIIFTYAAYYNQSRPHLALYKDAPLKRTVQRSRYSRSGRAASPIRPDMIFGKDKGGLSVFGALNDHVLLTGYSNVHLS
jgi:hypothetical protein